MTDIVIRQFAGPGFAENAYLVWRDGSATAIAVDPGSGVDSMIDVLEREGLDVEAIVLTHAHVDHVEGLGRLAAYCEAPVWLHPADRPLYDRAVDQGAMFGIVIDPLPAVDHELADDQHLDLAGLNIEVRHVPGHSPGHVILYIADAAGALVGDVVFQGSIGRTDLPGGDFPQLVQGIRKRVFTLPPETRLYPGHGPATTVSHEQATNPFLIPQYGGGLA